MASQLFTQLLLALPSNFNLFSNTQPPLYCIENCFTPSQLSIFNSSLTLGSLIRPELPTHYPTLNGNQDFRISPSTVQYLNFQTGWNLNTTRGRIPDLVVIARDEKDIVEAVQFAAEHRLRLRIKNSGHDYIGRSSEANSFTIFTHFLKQVVVEDQFIPVNAPEGTTGLGVIRAGAGASMLDMYKAADEAGVLFSGGTTRTIGAAGGYAVNGGHGPLSPTYGLAIDNILQFKTVIANGSIVFANEFTNPTLFKALRGGGGAFGINLEVVFKTHTPPVAFIGAFGEFEVVKGKPGAWKELQREWLKVQIRLSEAGFAGYSYMRTNLPSPFSYILPNDNLKAAQEAWRPFLEFIKQHEDISIKLKWVQEEKWFKLWSGEFTASLQSLDEVGINLLLGGRLVPAAVVHSKERRDDLADWVAGLPSPAIIHLVAGGEVSKASSNLTSINPLWRETLLHIDLPVSWPSSTSPEGIKGIETYLTKKTLELGTLCKFDNGEEGAYPSEGDFNEKEWQRIWYGRSYPNLLKAKKEWDSNGVFTSWKAVGSEIVGY